MKGGESCAARMDFSPKGRIYDKEGRIQQNGDYVKRGAPNIPPKENQLINLVKPIFTHITN